MTNTAPSRRSGVLYTLEERRRSRTRRGAQLPSGTIPHTYVRDDTCLAVICPQDDRPFQYYVIPMSTLVQSSRETRFDLDRAKERWL